MTSSRRRSPPSEGDSYKLLYREDERKAKVEAAGEELLETPTRRKVHWYVRYCKLAHKFFGKMAKPEISEEYRVTLAFLSWDLKPRELNSAPLLTAAITFPLAALIALSGIFVFNIQLSREYMTIYLVPFVAAFGLVYYAQAYPKRAAEDEKLRSLTHIPTIVNYLVMSMKLTPNLERALQFAAEHSEGKVADDLRKLVWEVKMGTYPTIEEALDHLAWQWGTHSPEFKHALMLIRSSVLEPDEVKREAILDKAISDVLEGIKGKMDVYSRAMNQPSVYLYYFGVLLPLLLIIVLPVGSVMGSLPLAQLWVLVLLYNILIPIGSLYFARMILRRRPPTRIAPVIPKKMPGLPKPGWFKVGESQVPAILVAFMVLLILAGAGYLIDPILNEPPKPGEMVRGEVYLPLFTYAGIGVGLVSAVSFYLWSNNKDRRGLQKDIMRMEDEFQDSLYILASRLGEGKPIESALQGAIDFQPNSEISKKIFVQTLQNITMLGMTIKTALFDKAYGSLRYIPSDFIRGTMRIVVDSLTLGVQTASRSLMSMSMQIHDSQEVERDLKALLNSITTMMSTMAVFIAPVVLGITVALQKLIMDALVSVSGSATFGRICEEGSTVAMGEFGNYCQVAEGFAAKDAVETLITQEQLLLVVALYVIEIVVILIYFAVQVNEGKNDLSFKVTLAKTLPLAMMIFFATVFVAMAFTNI